MTRLVYCDASVLVSRVVQEMHSAEVSGAIEASFARKDVLVSSQLAALEVHRAVRRNMELATVSGDSDTFVEQATGDLVLLQIDVGVLDVARSIPGTHLGSLDAIHVASALLIGADAVLTRDRRMARACEAVGLAVA